MIRTTGSFGSTTNAAENDLAHAILFDMQEEIPIPINIECYGPLHPQAILGFKLHNEGKYWLAHEALEDAWREETGKIRNLYRGILQVSVTYLHVQRGNYAGAVKVYRRSKRWLNPFPDNCRGINVGKIKADLDIVYSEVLRLGPDRLSEFDQSLLKPYELEISDGD